MERQAAGCTSKEYLLIVINKGHILLDIKVRRKATQLKMCKISE